MSNTDTTVDDTPEFEFGRDGQFSFDLTDPAKQVPPPPVDASVDDLQASLENLRFVVQDTASPFGRTRTNYATRAEYEKAKRDALAALKSGKIERQIAQIEAWEKKWAIVENRFGNEIVYLTAAEVRNQQAYIKAATNKKNTQLSAYDSAVKKYFDLKKRLDKDKKTPEYEKQAQLLDALRTVDNTVTPEVVKYRSSPIITEFAQNANQHGLLRVALDPATVPDLVSRTSATALRAADRELSTRETIFDEYGRPKTYTYVKSPAQERQFADFEARITGGGTAVTPPVGAAGVPADRVGTFTPPPQTAAGGPPGVVTGRSQRVATPQFDSQGRPVRMGRETESWAGSPTDTPAGMASPAGARPTAATADAAERAGTTGGVTAPVVTATTPRVTTTGGAATTTTAGTTGRATGGASGATTGGAAARPARMRPVSEQAWMAEFQRLYPAYKEWTSGAVVQHFGQDFIDLIRKVSSGEVEYTDEEFQAALRNTQYGMRTNQYQMQFDALRPADQENLIRVTAEQIRKDYGDVEFTETQIAELARTAARSGLTGTGLRQEVYRSAFKMSEGQEVPVLRMQALRGEDADRINRVARAYGRKASDAEIRSILTGEPLNGVVLTEEGLTQRLQAEAKALFPQFADQIDAGVTLETIGDRYKSYAANLLEMPEDNIDMFSGPYLKAFGDREKGPLSLFEWQQTVKSDPTFGWQYTQQANDQATSIGLSLARAFGAIQ